MKYIRTIDNIYKTSELDKCEDRRLPNGYFTKEGVPLIAIKEADTIEELGDCFIAVDKNGNLCENPMIAKGHCFKSFCNYYKANGIDVDCYLAILTKKGLIYVAKMNDKGELVFLLWKD